MNRRSTMLTMVAGALASVSDSLKPTNDHNQRTVKVLSYKKGGKPFTRGKRSASLRSRANRRK